MNNNMYCTPDGLFIGNECADQQSMSKAAICAQLQLLHIHINNEIAWFYSAYTRGLELNAKDDLFRMWSVQELEQEHKEHNLQICPHRFYFADVMIWSYALYFSSANGLTTEVWADYSENGQVQLATSIQSWITTLGEDWDKALYNI